MNKLILIVVVVLLLGVGGYFVFIQGNKTPVSTPNSQQNQEPSVTESKIIIKGSAFSPATLTTKKGTTVIWTNEDPVPHQVKSGAFNSEIFSKGESFQFRFDIAGTYDYTCSIHPTMKGEIIIQD